MKEQATIFFHIPVGEQNILTIPKNKIEVKTYDVELEEVIDSEPRDSETAEEKWSRLREIVIRKAANRLLNEHPELKEKLNVGDLLHISGYWFGWNCKWNDGWVLLSNGFVGESYQQAVQKETYIKKEKKMDECRVEIVRASSSPRTGIIMHEGDYLCFDNRCFCFDGMEWTETTEQEISNVLLEKENVMKEEVKEKSEMPDKETDLANLVSDRIKNIVEERTGIPNNDMDLKTLLSCFIKAMIEGNSNRISTIQFYLVPLVFEKYGEMTVQELRILTYRAAREVAIEKRVVFGHVLDILKDNGIDLWKIANEEKK